ncbi:hypothetical protein TNIN_230301 [Trichonephila inaurata madagascariensis]|uniref:Uncharacterized protein n=1 Tax=Trichonephila inaurata madagascariensis TaxID=2747483 RepID=A0A8X6XEI9_9ARAC|nr:hypothetical protein TNIN_230301 [Trichonephila inaurata madagascariensis]
MVWIAVFALPTRPQVFYLALASWKLDDLVSSRALLDALDGGEAERKMSLLFPAIRGWLEVSRQKEGSRSLVNGPSVLGVGTLISVLENYES